MAKRKCPACLDDNLSDVINRCYRCEKIPINRDTYDPWGDFNKLMDELKLHKKGLSKHGIIAKRTRNTFGQYIT